MRARMRSFRRSRRTKSERWAHEFLTENAPSSRYVLRELERRGPLLSRELEDRSRASAVAPRVGTARSAQMLLSLHLYGEVTRRRAPRRPAALGSGPRW